MQGALNAKAESKHGTHKVGALICGYDNSGNQYNVAHPNYWPTLLEQYIGRDKKLGKASTTVHAEVATILKAPATEGANIYVTELPCPNCAKMIAEARIANVYIHSGTHKTPLGKKLKPFFENVSLPILNSAGINVYEIITESQTVHKIAPQKETEMCPIERPVLHIPLEDAQINTKHFNALIKEQTAMLNTPFAACYAKDSTGHYTFLCAQSHRSTGLATDQVKTINTIQNKYNPVIQPLNRLLLTCARYGLKAEPNYLYSSQTPSSREFVNLIGAGFHTLIIGDRKKHAPNGGKRALKQLENSNIIKIHSTSVLNSMI